MRRGALLGFVRLRSPCDVTTDSIGFGDVVSSAAALDTIALVRLVQFLVSRKAEKRSLAMMDTPAIAYARDTWTIGLSNLVSNAFLLPFSPPPRSLCGSSNDARFVAVTVLRE